jgi:hypothetical protein
MKHLFKGTISRPMIRLFIVIIALTNCDLSYSQPAQQSSRSHGRIVVSSNKRYLQYEDGRPFFWLGDTGWLLFEKLNREDAAKYLEDRKEKGFNVIQCVLIHSMPEVNCYGDSAFIYNDPTKPAGEIGSSKENQGGFWNHVDFIVDKAEQLGLSVALVPVWGGVVHGKFFTVQSAQSYARFLAERYGKKSNIFWINGGDTRGDRNREIWEAIGSTLKKYDRDHLITFHPFGRTQSSTWFHTSDWLDFNMFQSGHRRYDQDDTPMKYGEDNWRYVQDDYAKVPAKPTLDGEPSYENIPQGLHDTTQPYWNASDVRRYAYWSVFAGAFGHTYGNNAVMQMLRSGDKPAYGARKYWYESLMDTGASQMRYLKNLMLSRPYFDRVGDQGIVADGGREKYERVIATRGRDYLMAYSYTGRTFKVNLGCILGASVKAWWYSPRNGEVSEIGVFENRGIREFDSPGIPAPGNDWVLVLDDAAKGFDKPGVLRK